MSKGSIPRPIPDRKKFESEWSRIFDSVQDVTTDVRLDSDVTSSKLEEQQGSRVA